MGVFPFRVVFLCRKTAETGKSAGGPMAGVGCPILGGMNRPDRPERPPSPSATVPPRWPTSLDRPQTVQEGGPDRPSTPCANPAAPDQSVAGPNGSLLREHGPTAAGTVRNLVFVCCARKPGPPKQTVPLTATVPAAVMAPSAGKEPSTGLSRPTECVLAQGRSGGGGRNGLGRRNRPRVAPWYATLAQVRNKRPRSRLRPG